MGNYTSKWATYRPKITAFFRFLKEYRKNAKGVPSSIVVEDAFKAWQGLNNSEESRYTSMNDDSPEHTQSEDSIEYPPHKPIRSYPDCNEMSCKPQVPECGKKRKKASCKPKRKKASCKRKRKKTSCKRKRKRASCRPKRKKRTSCKPKRKSAPCAKKKKKSSCKVKHPGKSSKGRFSFASMFKRKSCAAKKENRRSCSRKKSTCELSCKKTDNSETNTFKCGRSGLVTTHGFVNFLRVFRKKNCGLRPQVIIRRGALAWKKLSREEKRAYKKMGCAVTKTKRRKKSAR